VFCDLFVRGEKIRRQATDSESKDVFLASVIHELQTPLAAAKAQAQLALHQLSDRQEVGTARALRIVSRNIDRLTRLVSDLLDMNRLENGKLELHPEEFDLASLLEEVRARMQVLGERHSIRLQAPERLPIVADRDRVDQVIANLLANAIRYSPEGGPIEIKAERMSDAVQITVSDRGLGVPKEHQQLIFERFGRAHGHSFAGLGLGLTISKSIVERHGGKIWVESTGKPGDGSTFHVELPSRPDRTASPGPATRAKANS